MTIELHHLGWRGRADQAETIVDRFRETADVQAAVVWPWNRIAGADDITIAVAETTAGQLHGPRSECRWRVEGDEVTLSVVSLHPLDLGVPTEVTQVEPAHQGDLPSPQMMPGALLHRSASPPSLQQQTWMQDGTPLLTMTTTAEES